MFCTRCGMKAVEGASFCQKCGARLPVGEAGRRPDTAADEKAVHFRADEPVANDGAASDLLDVTLVSAGANKVYVIKTVRELTGLGLKEAKELVERTPVYLKKGVTQAEAKSIKETLMNAGAIVTFTNREGSSVDLIVHCKACGAALEDGGVCRACGRVFASPPERENAAAEADVRDFLDSNVWAELLKEFKQMPTIRKVVVVLGALAAIGLIVLLLRLIFSSFILLIAAVAGGYYIYDRWGANYITEYKYNNKIRELHLPKGMSPQMLLGALSHQFNYPYCRGVRYGENGECVIDGKYSAYAVTIYDNDTAALRADLNVESGMKRAVMLEGMAICSYLNKFFNPCAPDDVVKAVKALKSAEKQRKTVGIVITAASVLLVAAGVLEYALPGGLQRITRPGAEVRGAYLTEYSEAVTIEEAFEHFFSNEKWSTYNAEGYSYVAFDGACEFMGEKADIRITFKITGEEFLVDSLEVNGREQGDLLLYSLLSKVYEEY